MSRGMAKMQAKEKRAKADAKVNKVVDGKAARSAQLRIVCCVCKAPLSDPGVYKAHFESKHPKAPQPASWS